MEEHTDLFEITREIGIDAAHRVPDHHSQCRHLHGHRYTIHASARGSLITAGSQKGMVIDFGFLKAFMMEEIAAYCDHGAIVYANDEPLCKALVDPEFIDHCLSDTQAKGYCLTEGPFGKVYLVNFIPTAENLARHWFTRLSERLAGDIRFQGATLGNVRVRLSRVRVWETPNCYADYPAAGRFLPSAT